MPDGESRFHFEQGIARIRQPHTEIMQTRTL
jgi:hypothetical protein